MEVGRVAHPRASAQDGVRVSEARSFDTRVGAAVMGRQGLFRLSIGSSRVLSIL